MSFLKQLKEFFGIEVPLLEVSTSAQDELFIPCAELPNSLTPKIKSMIDVAFETETVEHGGPPIRGGFNGYTLQETETNAELFIGPHSIFYKGENLATTRDAYEYACNKEIKRPKPDIMTPEEIFAELGL